MLAVTETPLWLTELPLASRSCTTGCMLNATPLCAPLEGWVVIASLVAGSGSEDSLPGFVDPSPHEVTNSRPAKE
jgi:hypothetical protein